MELLKFTDRCKIIRETGQYDEWDNPVNAEVVYDGNCMFQAGGQTSLSFVMRNDVVYLPGNDVLIETNDLIEVTTSRGRIRRGIVSKVRDIETPLTYELLTKIEIKQSTEE